jgi:EpsD family peptidyl-prolyl cis-trans isomerase
LIRFIGLSPLEIFFSRLPRLPFLSMAALLVVTLGACGKSELPGQPLARVNGKAITEYQLGNELLQSAGTASAPDVPADAVPRKVLQELIDRELLQAEAVRGRIDRDPHVAAALENARAQILAQAYLQSRVAYVHAPSREEVRSYFDKHPEKFAGRKLFHMKEITLPASEVTAELKAAMDSARTLDDVSAWLDGRRIAHTLGKRLQSSADLEKGQLSRMQDMQAGQMFIMLDRNSASLLAVADIQASPLTFEVAAPQIERMLLDQRGRELGESELARLRADARVEYADKAAARYAGSSREPTPAGSEKIVRASGALRDAAQ